MRGHVIVSKADLTTTTETDLMIGTDTGHMTEIETGHMTTIGHVTGDMIEIAIAVSSIDLTEIGMVDTAEVTVEVTAMMTGGIRMTTGEHCTFVWFGNKRVSMIYVD